MAKYLIHCCNQRQGYVSQSLVPSMLKQGIKEEDIEIWLDTEEKGCLEACMYIFSNVPDDNNGTWHLQDDILISKDFKQKTEENDRGLVCGICTRYNNDPKFGEVSLADMWYSFPCIRIPNYLARECSDWYYEIAKRSPAYEKYVKANKYDDSMFKWFLEERYPDIKPINLKPNIVEHADYLVGGSIINPTRRESATALYWEG